MRSVAGSSTAERSDATGLASCSDTAPQDAGAGEIQVGEPVLVTVERRDAAADVEQVAVVGVVDAVALVGDEPGGLGLGRIIVAARTTTGAIAIRDAAISVATTANLLLMPRVMASAVRKR